MRKKEKRALTVHGGVARKQFVSADTDFKTHAVNEVVIPRLLFKRNRMTTHCADYEGRSGSSFCFDPLPPCHDLAQHPRNEPETDSRL